MEGQPAGHLSDSFAYTARIWFQFQLAVCLGGSLTRLRYPMVKSQPFLGSHSDNPALATGTSSASEIPVSHFFVLKDENRATVLPLNLWMLHVTSGSLAAI